MVTEKDVIDDLLKLSTGDGNLEKDPNQSLLQFAIKEYTGGRFYQSLNRVLSKREYLKVSNYICSILRGLPEVKDRAYK